MNANAQRIANLRAQLETRAGAAEAALASGNTEAAKAALEEVKELRARLKAEEDYALQLRAMAEVPVAAGGGSSSGWREIRQAMLEKRAISANGTGVNTVDGVIKALVDGGKLRSLVSLFKAPNAQSLIPVFAPGLALPVGNAPGATSISADSTAVLGPKTLALKAWYSILGVANDALISTDIEAELPGIFAKAFEAAIDKMICVGAGSGSDGLGLFTASASGVPTGQDLACAAAGTPKWVDFVKLAGDVLAMGGDLSRAAIIGHPAVITPLLSEATTATEGLKMELLTKGSIMSIPVIMTGHAPTTLTAGSYVAVGGYMDHYALAIAQELRVDPIRTVGSDVVSFQAFLYMQGSPIVGTSFKRLKTV